MKTMPAVLIAGLLLGAGVVWGQEVVDPAALDSSGETVQNVVLGGEGEGADNAVEILDSTYGNSVSNDSDGNDLSTNTARSENGSASAVNGSKAWSFTDDRVGRDLFGAALSSTDLDATVSKNSVSVSGKYVSINRVEDHAFHEPKGVTLLGQNSGINSLVQQNFTISATVNADHRLHP